MIDGKHAPRLHVQGVPAARSRGATVLAGVALLLAGLFAAAQLATWPARLGYPGEGDFVEGSPLAEMVHLRQGIRIYAPLSSQRYDTANFGPLYYLLGSRLVNPAEPAYGRLRILSLLGTLGCAAGCALLAFWLTRSSLAAVLAPLLFLGHKFVTRHGLSARSDSLAMALVLAGFLLAYHFRTRRLLLLSVPLFLVGFFYKQQFVAAPLAVLIYLLWEKRYRLAGEFASLLAAGGLALLALFQFVVFRGQAFLLHFFVYNLLPLSSMLFLAAAIFFGLTLLIPLLAAGWFLRKHPDRLLTCYLACAVVLSLATVGRAGSSTYYFFECAIILSSLFAAQIALGTCEMPAAGIWVGVLAGALLLGALWPGFPAPKPEDAVRDRELQSYLRAKFAPGTPALGYYVGDLIRAGLDVPFTNLYHYTQLMRKGTCSDRSLVEQLRDHRYGVVLLDFNLKTHDDDYMANFYLTAATRRAILDSYGVAAVFGLPGPEKRPVNDAAYVWVPRTDQPAEPEGNGR